MSFNVNNITSLANRLNLGMAKENFGGFLQGLSNTTQPATTSTAGVVKQAATVTSVTNGNSTAAGATIVASGGTYTAANLDANFSLLTQQLNACIAALRAAGIMQ